MNSNNLNILQNKAVCPFESEKFILKVDCENK